MNADQWNEVSEGSLESLEHAVLSNSTSSRCHALQELQDRIDSRIPPEIHGSILRLLFKTYPLFIDRPSRRAAQQSLVCLFKAPISTENLKYLVQVLREESVKSAIAPGNAFVLVEWCSLLLQYLRDDPQQSTQWALDVISAHARLLETCLRATSKESIKHSAIIVTRRVLRAVFSSDKGEDVLRTSVARLTGDSSSGQKNAPFLGVISGVCVRMESRKPVMEDIKIKVWKYYAKEIIGSRSPIPDHISNGLYDFISSFATYEDLETEVWPQLEKSILRSPEIVFSGLIPPLCSAIPAHIDLSEVFTSRFVKPLLSNLKSTNSTIRNGAIQAFRSLISRCRAEKSLLKAAEEVMAPLKTNKITNAEQRALHAQLPSAFPNLPELSQTIVRGFVQVLSREASEIALEPEIKAFCKHLSCLIESGTSIDGEVSNAVSKGCGDKRVSFRKLWLTNVCELLWSFKTEVLSTAQLSPFLRQIITKLQQSFDEIVANPLPSSQSGIVSLGYIMTALSVKLKGQKDSSDGLFVNCGKITSQSLSMTPKPSFLLNAKILNKLASGGDLSWLIRALSAVSTEPVFQESDSGTRNAWGQGFIYAICASNIPPPIRKEATHALTLCYLKSPRLIGETINKALWHWLQSIESEDKDSAAVSAGTGNKKLHMVVKSITPRPSDLQALESSISHDTLKEQLIGFIVLCHDKLIPGASWIDVALRIGTDPGELVREMPEKCLEQIIYSLDDPIRIGFSKAKHAAWDAAATLAFVAPDVMIPRLVDQMKDDLLTDRISKFSPTDAAIARTPDGTTFVDVLSTKSKQPLTDKNTKGYDILKWEEELREQLAQKKGQPQKKLTADEQAKVKAQLAKEAAIRKEVQREVEIVKRGAGIIKALATGPPTDAEGWINPAANALTALSRNGAGLFVGDSIASAYIACADRISTRLDTMRPFIGAATLRALGESCLPSELEAEPLGSLVVRILYRLRFSSEQRPFDTVTLGYILPLFFIILEQKNGIEGEGAEEGEEQVLLVLEFLSFHTNSFSDPRLPRKEVIHHLVLSMQRYTQHYKVIKDTLLDFFRCISPNIENEELETLFGGTIVPETTVRTAVLQAILSEIDLTEMDFSEHIWLGCHDGEGENVKISEEIWEENALDVDESSPSLIVKYLESRDSQLRGAAARALAHAVKLNANVFPEILEGLKSKYRQEIRPKVPEKDAYGMPKKVDVTDKWEPRSGIALAFKAMATEFQGEQIINFLRFLIDEGPLADPNPTVRRQMAESGTTLITISGQNHVEELMPVFEQTLETSDKATEQSDWLNEAVIVLYGSLGRHLKTGDRRLQTVIEKLLESLSTPSETVQSAVADCLPPLVRLSPSETGNYVQEMLDQLCKSKNYAARRGAAYGLAGIVSGAGISSLRKHRIMARLQESLENKKDQNQRQGAVLAYELFPTILGRIFEPYVIQIVPQLLAAFGDTSIDVRDACLEAAKACFSNLSSFGVKEILPTLLDGLDDPQWRSKKGACDLLGAMAYLDPHQLAASLPEITPALTVVLNDSHKEVRNAANRSLQRFGEVISNPEVKGLVGVLLKALSDPTKYTDDALDSLIKVSFVHYLDAPSLALVARILERGLEDRSATKRKSAEIIGSLAHLTERKDLTSHLPVLIAGLRLAIVDPVPTTRATASKALGSLIEKLGEDALPDLIPDLMYTLKSDTGAGDRLGSAQALSEVLAGLGTSRLEEILPTILQNVSSSKPTVREGFMSLFIYLPACFGNGFAAYLSKIIPPILAGLADDIEAIRETSLRAGRLLVKNFASKAIDLLLPELERGLADDSHRIRLSSVELVGDLLFNITGISQTDVEDEEEGAAQAGQSLLEVLGEEKRNKVLSSLYICRCDTSGLVRTASINVWKALVATPRTLKELVPTLSQLIIRRLGSSNMEQKVIAGNALGDLIRKAGEGVLATLLPSLGEGLQNSTDVDARQGICIALRELIVSASPDALQDHEKSLISIVRTALVDNDENVREAAAEAFDVLQQILGKKAVDQVLPYLLTLLRNEEDAEQALSALLTLLTETTRANIILPNLVPTLLTSPITQFNARAIASLSEVAGPAMTRRIPAILNALMDNIISTKDDDLRLELSTAFDAVLVSVDEFDGLNVAMNVMLTLMKHEDHRRRANTAVHLATFFSDADVDFSRYHPDLIRVLLVSFDDHDKNVVKTAWTALNRLMGSLRKEEMELLVAPTRQVLRQVGVPGADLPGFSLPKGIMAIFPIFLQGLLNGSVEQRVQSALAIADIIDRTNADSLKPLVTQITGPLIRVVSERSVDLKCAVFFSLNKLLEKIPLSIKPFLPQLQRTFARGLADSSSETLRNRAAKGLGILITLTPRVDPLIAELITGSKTPDVGVKNAMFKALHEVVSKAGGNMSEASRQSILGLIDDDANNSDDAIIITNARLLGALVKTLPASTAIPLVKSRIITTHFSQSSILGLNALLVESPSSLMDNFTTETPSIICQGIASKNPSICDNSLLAAGKYLLTESDSKNFESTKSIFEALVPVLQPGVQGNARRLALVVIRTVSRLHPELVIPHLPLLAPPVFSNVRDIIIPVKLAGEAAFLSLFSVIDSNSAVFDKYMAGPGADLPAGPKRSMQDYFKRVAMRLGGQARERREAEGGQGGLGLSNDELDDEKEVWSVGKMELGEDSFGGD